MTGRALHALVLADGGACHREALERSWPGWASGVELVVAADGGVRLAEALGLRVDRWVGDGDSIDPERLEALRASGIPIRLASADKDQSDTELAVLEALAAGATELTVLGALGGKRLDHELANIGLLALEALGDRPTRLLGDAARVTMIRASSGDEVERLLAGRVGDIVSLLPVGTGVDGVTTRGLRYPLRDEPLPAGPARGLSNVRIAADAGVVVRGGALLVVEVPANLAS